MQSICIFFIQDCIQFKQSKLFVMKNSKIQI